MTPVELLRDCSFEIPARGHARLTHVQSLIPQGTVVSIAFLSTDTIPVLIEAAAAVRRLGFTPKPHIAARRLRSRDELTQLLGGLRAEAQVDRAFVIAGDASKALGPFENALSVIDSGLLSDFGIERVGVAGYPDGHPDISEDSLWSALGLKTAALARQGHAVELVTQFGFNAAAVVHWIGEARQRRFDQEIRIGIPGPATVKSLLHFAARCGVGASAGALARYGASLTQLLGTATPDRLLRELGAGFGAASEERVRLHFHPFGGLDKAAQWAHDSSIRISYPD